MQNAVVTPCVVTASSTPSTLNGPGSTTVPPATSVLRAKRIGAECCNGEHTRCTSAASSCHCSTSSPTTRSASASPSTPLHTPLGRPVVPEV